jgi:ABC-type amino acid transport substrate-binding protein/signal transduction histidine kinase/CheY-like chemotaxis protein
MSALAAVLAGATLLAQEAKPPILSACEIEYPPYCRVDAAGNPDGFSVELLRATLAAMGREVVFRTGPWHDVKGWLEEGEVEALPLVGRTPEREAFFDFTFPYMSLHGAIVVRRDTEGINTLEDLRGHTVAVMRGDNAEEFLRREERGVDIHVVDTFEQALRELAGRRHHAVLIQRLVALRLVHEMKLGDALRVVNRPVDGFRQDFCFAVHKGDADTLALLNEGLALVMADGTLRRLHAKWFAVLELPTNRPIMVGGDNNYPPYEYLDRRSRPAGYNVDLTRAIARELGLDVRIQLGPWAEIMEKLENGEIDILQGMFHTTARSQAFEFSQAHAVNHYVAVVRRKDGPAPSAMAQMTGRRIAVQAGDVATEFLVQAGLGDQLIMHENQEAALRAVVAGEVDVCVVTRTTALSLVSQQGWKKALAIGKRPLFLAEYCYAVRQGEKALLAEFSEGLAAIKESGEYRQIQEKWLGVYEGELGIGFLDALRYSAMVLVPLLLILLAVFLWSWSLRRQVERRTTALRQQREFIHAVLDHLPMGVAVNTVGPDVRFEYMNEQFPGIYRTTREALADTNRFWETVYEDAEFRQEIQARVEADCASGDPQRMQWVDIPISRQGQEIAYVSARNIPLPEQGVMISTVFDVTTRRQAEIRVEHLNRVLRSIRDVNQLIVRERDRHTLIREGCRLLVDNRGYTSALIILMGEDGRPAEWAEAGMGAAAEFMAALLAKGELPPCCAHVRTDGNVAMVPDRHSTCRDCPAVGRHLETQSLCTQLAHEGIVLGHLVVALSYDMSVDDEELSLFTEMAGDPAYALHTQRNEAFRAASERERALLEQQLAQAQKMDSVGRLASGVAHDFNNALGVILGYAEMSLRQLLADSPLHAYLTAIQKAARHSADLTGQLLAFARKQAIAPRSLDLNQTVAHMLDMLRRLVGEAIDVQWFPREGLWPVKADSSQLGQVLANLSANARDAIADIGKITIETDNVHFDAAYCARHAGFAPGDFVMLAFSDNGCGMDAATLKNAFEPFFTTKAQGKGTGLGLAMIYGIVRQNAGFINAYSEPGQGTTFRIYLPRHAGAEAAAPAGPPPEAEAIPRSEGETILLVEDNDAIRTLAGEMLATLGYHVLDAATPGEAIRIAETRHEAIHLLMTDVVMPEMNGRNLAVHLARIHPAMRRLFMSGYTANIIAHQGVLDEGIHFIQKPFAMGDLARKVREALEDRRD